MCVVREGKVGGRKGSSRSAAVLSTSSFQAAGGSKDTKQAPAPWVSVAAAGQALLPSCGEQDRETAPGPPGPREGLGRPCRGAGVRSHGGQLGITSPGFGPGPPSLALASSGTLRANLHSQFTLVLVPATAGWELCP